MSLLCATGISAHAAVITVTNTNDSGPGSSRQAITDTNDGDTIVFDLELPATILLTSQQSGHYCYSNVHTYSNGDAKCDSDKHSAAYLIARV